jgi:hypothetical protein
MSAASSNTLVPPLIRPYPSSPKNNPQTLFPPRRESICGYLVDEKRIGLAERQIFVPVHGYYIFQNPPYTASRQLLIPWIAAVGTSFSPLPCQAWHGYGVTIAHRVGVEVGADGPASEPPSGAAAVAPPAGAIQRLVWCKRGLGKAI